MSRNRKCPVCRSNAVSELQEYKSGKVDKDTHQEIVVGNIEIYKCCNEDCQHTWLPIDQERKIDRAVARESRFDLLPDQISLIRQSLPFDNKFEAADFLCLNEKAFTKWELGVSEPNRAYDLLLRLAVYSRDNLAFVRHLHEKNFRFDLSDYQVICDQYDLKWNFDVLTHHHISGFNASFDVSTSVTREPLSQEQPHFVVASNLNSTVNEEGALAA